MRRNQFRAACPGIGWEREQQRKPTTIGGRSTRWRVTTTDNRPAPEAADEDTVIIRGTD